MRKLIYGVCGLILAGALMGNTSCQAQQTNSEKARAENMAAQGNLMVRANAAVPVPQTSNFLSREAVAKQVKRLDEKGKLFYIYILADNGQQIGYFVAYTRPVATCSLLTPPDDVWERSLGNGGYSTQRLTAPGLGGTYSPGPCNSNFFFDAATDAYIEFGSFKHIISDQPLGLKVEPIKVIQQSEQK